MSVFEVIHVDAEELHCDGNQGGLGHPRVFLHIDRAAGKVVCPYCSKTYVYAGHAHHHSAKPVVPSVPKMAARKKTV